MDNTVQLKQLYWQCRRGMWELDLYLIPFLKQCYASLPSTLQDSFINLLQLPDPELHANLTGFIEPADKNFIEIINLVRDYAQHSDKSQVF